MKLIYLIRTEDEIISTFNKPFEVTIFKKSKTWSLRGLPSELIGYFDKRFYYSDAFKGVIGVFDVSTPNHISSMLTCYDWHLRNILGQPRDIMGKVKNPCHPDIFPDNCQKKCDCQNPPPDDWDGKDGVYHVSTSCPIHNFSPDKSYGDE